MSISQVNLELADELRKQAEISSAKALAGQYAGLVNDSAAAGVGGMAEAANAIQNGKFREEWCKNMLSGAQNMASLTLVDNMLDLNSGAGLEDLTSQKVGAASLTPEPQVKKSSTAVKTLFQPPGVAG